MNSFTISLSRLTELFDKFNEKANKGEMQKLPYNMWKTMRKYISWANAQAIKCDVKIKHETWKENEKFTFYFSPEFVVTIPFQPGEKPSFFAMILNEMHRKFLAKLDTDTINYYLNDDSFAVTLTPDTVLSAETNINSKYLVKNCSLSLASDEYDTYSTLVDGCKDYISSKVDYYSSRISDLSTDKTEYYWDTQTTPLITPATIAETALNTYDSNTGLYVDGEEIRDMIKHVAEETYENKTTIINKENKTTMKNFINFDFGPVGDNIHMSPYGMAIKNADGVYVSYNKSTGQIMDVDVLNFSGMNKFMYKVPVAVSAVAVGDIIVHQKVPMFVTAIHNGNVSVVDIFRGEHKTIMPTRSPFGFDFITKIVSFVDMSNMGGANADNPFGNMLPLFLMSDSGLKDSDAMLMYMMTMGGQNSANMFSNPMMMYFFMNDNGKSNDLLPLMLMMNGGFGNTCHCNESTTGVKVAVTPVGN